MCMTDRSSCRKECPRVFPGRLSRPLRSTLSPAVTSTDPEYKNWIRFLLLTQRVTFTTYLQEFTLILLILGKHLRPRVAKHGDEPLGAEDGVVSVG